MWVWGISFRGFLGRLCEVGIGQSVRILIHILLGLGFLVSAAAATGQGRYLEQDDFLQLAFPGGEPNVHTLWITNSVRDPVEALLGHPFGSLRVRYWMRDGKTAWIFDEIGKERPITIGVTVRDDAVEIVRVLEFRESRGWEVRYPFFTDQFTGARFVDGHRMDRPIDGITGATLSVGAMTRIVHLALFLNGQAETRGS